MDNFVSKEVEKVYLKFKNNNRLQKALDDNHLILKRMNFIGEYTDTAFKSKMEEVNSINKDKLYSLASLCYENEEAINNTEISILVDNSFLRREIKDIYEGVDITDVTLKEIFYCFKHCTVSSFFQNNKKYFTPEYDLSKIEENGKLSVFMDALLKEFDKLNDTLSGMKDIIDIDNVDGKYLTYLSQLLGYEKRDIPALNEESFRELVKNIVEIYKIKGTNYSFELFFNFLGFNIEIEEFFFDRRYFYKSGGNNEFTGEKSVNSYNHYLTTTDPILNETDIFSISETVSYANIGKQLSLLEFDDLTKKYGAEAVLGYSRLDKNGELYTGNVYTYFKTNYIYYNVSLPDRYPTAKEIVAITSYLNFLSPVYIMKTLETQSAEVESDVMELSMIDWHSNISNGVYTPVREYVIYNYTNSLLGQNYGKKLVFSRTFNYTTTVNGTSVSFLEVNPYPGNPYDIQNEWYTFNDNNIDFNEAKAFVAAHPEFFGKKIDIITSSNKADFIAGDSGFEQDFDNTSATDIKALTHVNFPNRKFKRLYSINKNLLKNTTQVFENISALNSAMLEQEFRDKLYDGLEVAVKETETVYGVYKYLFDTETIIGVLNNPVQASALAKYQYSFETLTEAQNFVRINKVPFGDKIFINDKKLVYTYNYTTEKNSFAISKGYVFDTINAARTYFNNHKNEIKNNVDFYIKSESKNYRFIYKNRIVGQLIWSTADKALYSFVDGTADTSFKEINLCGLISEVNGKSYITIDPAYDSYSEEEDKQNFLFYNHNHKERPNNYKSFRDFEKANLPFLIRYYASTYYTALSYKQQQTLKQLIDANSSYTYNTLPEVLSNIYTGSYANDNNLLNLINTELSSMRDAVKVYKNGAQITTPNDTITKYIKLISLVTMFIDYSSSAPEDKEQFITMFADREYVSKVIAWRERYFNDETLNTAVIEPDTDIILGNAKAFLSRKFGTLVSPVNSTTADSFASFDNSSNKYFKPKIPFYGITNKKGTVCFYVQESDVIKYCDIGTFLKGKTTSFCNAVFYESFQKNYKQFIINETMKIPTESTESIYRIIVSGRKFIAIETNHQVSGSINLVSPNIEGHLLLNNFKKKLKDNRLVYPTNETITVDSKGSPTRWTSWGYDKDITIRVENKNSTFVNPNITLDSNNDVVITTPKTSTMLSSIGCDTIEIDYLPQTMEVAFTCGSSEDNTDSLVFVISGGSANGFEQGDTAIVCGGA